MTGKVQAVYADPRKSVVVAEADLPAMNDHSVRVRPWFSFISAGTELHTVNSLKQRAATASDNPPKRSRLGYSLAGEVLEVGAAVDGLRVGQRVACIGQGASHATEVVMAKNLVTPVPDGVSMRAASTAAMMCFALEGVRKAEITFGDHLLVIGAGAMGQMAAQLARDCGARVFLTDVNRHRLSFTRAGIETFVGDEQGWRGLKAAVAPYGMEKVVVCIGGAPEGLLESLYGVMARSPDGLLQGRIVFSGGARMTIPFASASGNLTFVSSAKAGPGYRDPVYEAGQDYPAGYVRWPVKRNVTALLDAVARGQFEIDPLITHEYAHAQAPEAYKLLSDRDTQALTVLLRYDAAGEA